MGLWPDSEQCKKWRKLISIRFCSMVFYYNPCTTHNLRTVVPIFPELKRQYILNLCNQRLFDAGLFTIHLEYCN